MLFGFRLLATIVVCYGGDVDTNLFFLFATINFNSYFLLYLLFGFTGRGIDNGVVVQLINTTIPKILTVADFLAPIFCMVYYYFVIQAG